MDHLLCTDYWCEGLLKSRSSTNKRLADCTLCFVCVGPHLSVKFGSLQKTTLTKSGCSEACLLLFSSAYSRVQRDSHKAVSLLSLAALRLERVLRERGVFLDYYPAPEIVPGAHLLSV